MHPRLRHPGFTLIELLVVVSIIALLIAILLPALGRARDSAKTVQCASLLRQIGIANHVFAEEHRGYFSPHFGFVLPNGGTGFNIPQLPAGVANWNHLEQLKPYMATSDNTGRRADTMTCVSMPIRTDIVAHHYAYPTTVGMSFADNWGLKRDAPPGPARFVLMTEMNGNWATMLPSQPPAYGTGGPTEAYHTSLGNRNRYVAPHDLSRSSGNGNYQFADGHVKTMPGDQGFSSLRPDGKGGTGGEQFRQMWGWW